MHSSNEDESFVSMKRGRLINESTLDFTKFKLRNILCELCIVMFRNLNSRFARFKTHNSTYNGDGNKQKGASIFFSDKFCTEDECLYKSDNGDLVIVKLVGKNMSVIVSNV